jgi:tetratricopeptide (TPR) repeat protein
MLNVSALKWWHYAILGAALLLVALLVLAPHKNNSVPEVSSSGLDENKYRDSVFRVLDKNVLSQVKRWDPLADGSPSGATAADSLFVLMKEQRQLVLAAMYKNKAARMAATPAAMLDAGKFAQAAAGFVQQPAEVAYLNTMAIQLLEKAVEMNATDAEAKIALASAYVKGSPDPMKGIGMLRQMVASDSTLVSAQLQLALFAVQSGQTEKAVARLKMVRRIAPENTEAMLYLAEVYATSGKTEEAIAELETFKKINKDALIAQQVDEYLVKLKNKNN